MWVLALIQTAQEIIIVRTGPERDCANIFLEAISTKRCVQIAMMADAADDGLVLTREHDDFDKADPSNMSDDVHCFLVKIVELYVNGKIVDTFSYTKYMLTLLTVSPVTVQISANEHKTIGDRMGVSQAIIGQCLGHMQPWVKLCVSVVRAEYPAFELVQSFAVFQCDPRRAGRVHGDFQNDIDKLALAFKQDSSQLRSELEGLRHVAACHSEKTGCSNFHAYKHAVHRAKASQRLHACHPTGALEVVLTRFPTFKNCTSKLEQDFSWFHDLMGDKRLHSLDDTESCLAKVLLDKPKDPQELRAVLAEAQSIWLEHYGISRTGATDRMDTGAKKVTAHRPGNGTSMWRSEFLAKRRSEAAAVAEAVSVEEGNRKINNIAAADVPGWDPHHQKELDFQVAKLRSRETEAYLAGHLTPGEVDDTLATEAAQMKAGIVARGEARFRRVAREDARVAGGTAMTLSEMVGMLCYVQPAVETPELVQKLDAFTIRRVDAPVSAVGVVDVAVVADVAMPGTTIDYIMKMRGGTILVPEVILGTRRGPALTFLPAIGMRRQIWVSDRVREANPQLAGLLRRFVDDPKSKWKLLGSVHEFELEKQRAQGQPI